MGRRRARPAAPAASHALLQQLELVFSEADATYAGHSCPASTECCRFHLTGREPYVTTIEVAALRHAIAARGGALSARQRALPLLPTSADEGTCPLLTDAGKCAVYAARPLGCRTFYCSRAHADAPVRQRRLNELVRRVREIAERHAPGAVQGRPLRRALAE